MKVKKKSKKSKKRSPDKKLSVAFPSGVKKSKISLEVAPLTIKKRRQYSPESLHAAYKAVKDSSISVNAAAKQYGVPLTTLRDRVDGRISIDTTRPGPPLLMSKEEEGEIAHFLHTMAKYGYRYTRLEIAEIATDQAVEKGKRRPRANALTTKWVDSFIHRWPGLKELSSRFKNKSDAEHTVRTYFDEIKKIIDKYKLLEKNNRIFNIMEINLPTDHSFSTAYSSKSTHQFKTENTTNTTLIACGSVTGHILPPFFVFQASKLKPEMMRGVPSNVNASVSDTGKCSPHIFRKYLNEHFLPQAQRYGSEPILLLLDGSRSHTFVGMNEWGRAHNVIFSFIPAHTTHLLQPLEVQCAEAVQKRYEIMCRRHLKASSGPCISRNSICELAYQSFTRVVTKMAVTHSFKKAGVYPDVTSDDSGDEMETHDETTYRDVKSEDIMLEVPDEHVFTEDLVVGQNQEVTEEEVVTTEEIIVSEDGQTEEVVVTHDGQILMTQNGEMIVSPEGHIVIHGGEIFLQPIQFAQSETILSPMKSDEGLSDSLGDTQCIINNGHIIDTSGSHVSSDSDLSSSTIDSSVDHTGLESFTAQDLDSNEVVVKMESPGVALEDTVVECLEDSFVSTSEADSSNAEGERDKCNVIVKRELGEGSGENQSDLLQKVLDHTDPK